MNAAVMTEYMGAMDTFKPTAMQIREVAMPPVKANQVLIKVEASSVNPVDWKFCSGRLDGWMPAEFPMIPGFDCSGTVVAVGPGCQRLKVGDEVWADLVTRVGAGEMHQGGGVGDGKRHGSMIMGGYGEYVATEESRVGLKPNNITFDQAGVIPLVALTALQALEAGQVGKGQAILILGGSGGNGICAIQMAKAMGASKIYATCSAAKADFVTSLGAEVIDYTKQDWADVLKGKNLDCIFDTIGPSGDKDCVLKAGTVLKKDGHFCTLLRYNDSLPAGMSNHFVLTKSDDFKDLDKIKQFCEAQQLSVPIQQTFPLEQVPDAFKVSMGGRVLGKLCIKVPKGPKYGPEPLAGKSFVIFGGSSGIGFAAAQAAVQQGASLIWILGRTPAKLDAAKAELEQLGSCQVRTWALNSSDEPKVKEFCAQLRDRSIDHLVTTPGGSARLGNLVANKRDCDGVRKQFDLKFFAQLCPVLAMSDKLKDHGSITMTSGILSRRTGRGNDALAISNAAIECLTRCLANDHGFDGRKIRVNCLSPGMTLTGVYGTSEWANYYQEKAAKSVPLQRNGLPREAAHAINFLQTNTFITGVVLDVDGGNVIKP
eukprot:CAMPEP_0175139342 /NCGR_PEP_ID=MMETSP0087-20121206/10848_1 /TAXON_ID=136419 /ORGANISM="Unknown Unknown, Strain D1" /LENGTH=597 /DNA_ID=CAMNT_0016422339 /DNA_START=169 /DNA_END=1962 /DNA_ORIENTATION=-